MAVRKRRCARCGTMFQPAQDYYRLCQRCNKDTYSVGFTSSKRRPGGADLMHGGQSRLRDGTLRRPLALRGNQCRDLVLTGFREFTTDYYCRPSGLSTIFGNAGVDSESLRSLSRLRILNNLLMEFCPAFRQWVYQFAGDKAMELIIEFYRLYGDPRPSLSDLSYNLDLNDVERYKNWTLNKLRDQKAKIALEQIAAEVAGSIQR